MGFLTDGKVGAIAAPQHMAAPLAEERLRGKAGGNSVALSGWLCCHRAEDGKRVRGKPMGLSVSEVFGTAFGVLKQRFGPLLGLLVLFFVVQIVATLVFAGVSGAAGMMSGDPAAIGAGVGLGMIVFYLIYFLISFAQSAAMTHQASSLHAPSLGDSLSNGVRSAPSLLGAYVLMFIAYLIAAIPIGLVFVGVAMAGTAMSVIFALLILPLLVWLACRLSMLVPVIAVEGVTNPINALTRTWAMTKGNSLSIFVVFLVFGIGAFVVLLILAAPLISAFMSAANGGTPPDIGALGIGSFAGLFIVSIVFGLLSPCIIAAIHSGLVGHLDQNTPEVFS